MLSIKSQNNLESHFPDFAVLIHGDVITVADVFGVRALVPHSVGQPCGRDPDPVRVAKVQEEIAGS